MARVDITFAALGICHMGVCAVADATDEEILQVCNRDNPSGTTAGWCRVVRDGPCEPVACDQEEGRMHFLVEC